MSINSIIFLNIALIITILTIRKNNSAVRVTPEETISEDQINGDSVSDESLSFISVGKAGVSGDGSTDVTDKLQQLFDKYDTVFFPKGNYLITKNLTGKSGQYIYGNGTANIVSNSTAPLNFIEVTSKKNVKIANINFVAPDNTKSPDYAVKIINSKDVYISNIRSKNAGLVAAAAPEGTGYKAIRNYSSEDHLTGSSNIFIDKCTGAGSLSAMKITRGVWLEYVNNWKVTNSSVKNFVQGVQWWGGDSNPEKNGDTSNERKTKNGIVDNVMATNIDGGGIWGSMGENITVKNCKVSNCGDVGIDYEGCFNSSAGNNIVKDCKNGCLATFHYNRNISFYNNNVSQSDAARPLACIFNSSQKQDNGSISFTNNNFSVDKGVGQILQQGPSNNILFEKNTLLNVILNLAFNNNRVIQIKNNTIKLTRTLNNLDYVIKAGLTNNNGKLTIENNKIISTVKQGANVYAINPLQADYNSSPVNIINNNGITGVENKYKVEWKGTNRGVTSKTFISSRSGILTKDIKKIDAGGGPSEIYLNNVKQ